MKDLYLISTDTLQNILENQIFMLELQKESCEIIERLFNPSSKYKLNLHNQSFLDFE
jgi:hypothetical protein